MLLHRLLKALNSLAPISLMISVMLLLSSPQNVALGATVLGNYPPTNDDNFVNFTSTLRKSLLFHIPAGNDYTLNSATLRLSSSDNHTYQVDLYASDGTTRGAFIASLGTAIINTGNVSTYTDATFTAATPILLTAGQRYWLEVWLPAPGSASRWASSVPSIMPSGTFNFLGYQLSFDGGGGWIASGVYNTISLDADIVVPPTATHTATNTPTPTDTSVPPTSTFTPTPTDTPVPPTSTFTPTPTDTPVAPTSTFTPTPTDTPVPPTSTFTPTPTDTPVAPTSTPTETVIPPTATPTLPFCVYGLPPGGVQGRVLIDVLAFYNPSLEATTNILVQGGSSWWIIDARNGFYKLWISCEGQPIWVLANTIAPNFDHVWQGAELPNAGE